MSDDFQIFGVSFSRTNIVGLIIGLEQLNIYN